MKTLNTGVVITYDKQGNIKTLYSPYYDKKEDNPVRGSILRYLHYKLKQIISHDKSR
jgi:hypothetical protein